MNLIWIAQITLLVVIATAILFAVRRSRRARPARQVVRVAPRAASATGSETLLQSLSAGCRQPRPADSRQPPSI